MIICPVCRAWPDFMFVNHILVVSCKCGRLTRWKYDNWSFVYDRGGGLFLSSCGTLYRYKPWDPTSQTWNTRRQEVVPPGDVEELVRHAVLLASIDEVMGV